ncbi:MAG: 5-deoxy-glucuronate isomerase [Chloroflexi bacterium]|nr:5-deoxy-glucuronate isomerase [Chloroflexota bacterium]
MLKTFTAPPTHGYHRIIGPDSGLRFFREYGILRLDGHAKFEDDTGGDEVMLHIVQGQCSLTVGAQVFDNLGERDTPFEGKPTAVYLPPQTHFAIEGDGLEMVISRAAAETRGQVKVIAPADVKPMPVGKDNWQRDVTMIAPPDFAAQMLIVGETLNPSGNWSGVPAHKHDQVDAPAESTHEEIYYFRFQRASDWGCLRVYENDGTDDVVVLKDRLVTVIPRGYHTVVVAPGSRLLYTFHLAGVPKKLAVTEDPNQVWIRQ